MSITHIEDGDFICETKNCILIQKIIIMPHTFMNLYLPCIGDILAYWAKRDPEFILQHFPRYCHYLSVDTEGNDPISSPSLRKNFEFLAQSNPEKVKTRSSCS